MKNKAIITIEEVDGNNIEVKVTFDPELNIKELHKNSTIHMLAAYGANAIAIKGSELAKGEENGI